MPSTVKAGCLRIVADAELPVARELQENGIGKCVQAARGEGAERTGDAIERPGVGDVRNSHGQRDAPLQPPQGRGDRFRFGPRSCLVMGRGELSHQLRKRGIRPMTPYIGHKIGVL
jgi:hypothetical protein